jgi:hypothetical protein
VTAHTSKHEASFADHVIDRAARVLELLLARAQRGFGRAELHIHAWRTGRDAETLDWVADIERRADTGALEEQVIPPELLLKYLDDARSSS